MVPVVVSAGLAVGVFCGLLFGLGTGKKTAAAEPAKVSNARSNDDTTVLPDSSNHNAKPPDRPPPKAGSNAGSAVAATAGSAGSAGSAAAGSNAGSAEPTIKATSATLVVEIKPDSADAKIFVDGKLTTSPTIPIELEPGTTKKKVKVLVKAIGYKDIDQEIDVEDSTTLKLELTKGSGRASTPTAGTEGTGGTGGTTARPSGNTGAGGNTGTGGNTGKGTGGSKGTGGKGKGKGSGLIDI